METKVIPSKKPTPKATAKVTPPETKPAPKPNPKPAPKTAPKTAAKTPPKASAKKLVEVKKELLEIELELSGIVESKKNTPVSVIPKAWAELVIEEVVPHGTMVKKGDVLVRFETKKLKESIKDKKDALPLSRLKLDAAKAELESMEKTMPLELEQTRRSKSQREADFAYFEDVRRPMNERDAREDLKYYKNYLEYSEEELRQLKKMYEK